MSGYEHISLSYVVPVYTNQCRGTVLEQLLNRYASYSRKMLERIQFIVVDDGSPMPVQIPDDIDLNILLLRIKEDIPWNQPGARNLGVVYARSEKVLITDVDHEFPEDTLQHALERTCRPHEAFMFERKEADGERLNPHPNTFLFRRSTFLGYYGYDEEFCGAYGYDDLMFREWQQYNGTRFRCLPQRFLCIHRAIDRNVAYHSLVRDDTRNARLAAAKRKEWAEYGRWGGHSRRFLEFTWERVMDRRMTGAFPAGKVCRWWKKLWLVRQLLGLSG